MRNTVTLHNGREVDSWSEDWRHESEARTLLAWTLEKRRAFLYGEIGRDGKRGPGIAAKRGPAALKRLEDTMAAIHAARKASR